jgi:hypothetical protein
MGNPDGAPPLGVREDVLGRWESRKYLITEKRRENVFYEGLAA